MSPECAKAKAVPVDKQSDDVIVRRQQAHSKCMGDLAAPCVKHVGPITNKQATSACVPADRKEEFKCTVVCHTQFLYFIHVDGNIQCSQYQSTHLHHMTFMYKTQHMDQCRLGAGRHQKYLHSSNFTCTNLHMQVVFRAL